VASETYIHAVRQLVKERRVKQKFNLGDRVYPIVNIEDRSGGRKWMMMPKKYLIIGVIRGDYLSVTGATTTVYEYNVGVLDGGAHSVFACEQKLYKTKSGAQRAVRRLNGSKSKKAR